MFLCWCEECVTVFFKQLHSLNGMCLLCVSLSRFPFIPTKTHTHTESKLHYLQECDLVRSWKLLRSTARVFKNSSPTMHFPNTSTVQHHWWLNSVSAASLKESEVKEGKIHSNWINRHQLAFLCLKNCSDCNIWLDERLNPLKQPIYSHIS